MELRPARADEFDAFSAAVLSAFHEELTDDERRRYMKIHEADPLARLVRRRARSSAPRASSRGR